MKVTSPCFTDRDSLICLHGIGPIKAGQLAEKGIHTVSELLDILPKDYLDLSVVNNTFDLAASGLYCGRILKTALRYLPNHRCMVTVSVQCNHGQCQLVLFNQPYLRKQLTSGSEIRFFGQGDMYRGRVVFTQPRLLPDDCRACLPLYSAIGAFATGWLSSRIGEALQGLHSASEDLPEQLCKKHGFMNRLDCWRSVHLPKTAGAALQARSDMYRRLAYREFVYFHLQLTVIRSLLRQTPRRNVYRIDDEFRQMLKRSLPFKLTGMQKKVLREIFADMAGPQTMQRLICGDVGSGKTVVVFVALLAALNSGKQGALLAPTEVLCRQHYRKAKAFFTGYPVELLTGETPQAECRRIRLGLQGGAVCLVIGTHALLSEATHFSNLALAVIDEQHRFGVSQRAALIAKGISLDLLVTTATPIPRTLLLSHYSDLSTSSITALPPGRKAIVTRQVGGSERKKLYHSLKRHLDCGEKIYIVVPRIEPDEENPELQSVQQLRHLLVEIFGGDRITELHGRMSLQEKEAALQRFDCGSAPVMLSTTVIEVGVDDPLATVMVVENADRFGLAALHQLRGRVGRGAIQSYCYLLASAQSTSDGLARLQVLCDCSDGFIIARKDLEMRGGGLVAGQEQVGRPIFRYGDPFVDRGLFEQARQDVAREISLKNPPQELRPMLQEYEKRLSKVSFS